MQRCISESRAEAHLDHARHTLSGNPPEIRIAEKYGAALIRLALDILTRKNTPPAVFMQHQMITAANVDRYYPQDRIRQ